MLITFKSPTDSIHLPTIPLSISTSSASTASFPSSTFCCLFFSPVLLTPSTPRHSSLSSLLLLTHLLFNLLPFLFQLPTTLHIQSSNSKESLLFFFTASYFFSFSTSCYSSSSSFSRPLYLQPPTSYHSSLPSLLPPTSSPLQPPAVSYLASYNFFSFNLQPPDSHSSLPSLPPVYSIPISSHYSAFKLPARYPIIASHISISLHPSSFSTPPVSHRSLTTFLYSLCGSIRVSAASWSQQYPTNRALLRGDSIAHLPSSLSPWILAGCIFSLAHRDNLILDVSGISTFMHAADLL